MAQESRSRSARRRAGRRSQRRQVAEAQRLPYSARNAKWFGAGIGTILIGYVCLSQPPVDGFLSLTLAPILLVIGYCILIPIALLIDPDPKEKPESKTDQTGAVSSAG